MRKLVTIRQADAVYHHPNADALDLVEIGGWTVITKRDEFKAGDLGVFLEIDSVVPVGLPHFEFLEKNAKVHKLQDFYGVPFEFNGTRIRTMKLRGIVSQGLFLPLSVLIGGKVDEFNVGTIAKIWMDKELDLSNMKMFNVVKYDKYIPVNGSGAPKGNFPWFIQKSDQERLANKKGKLVEWLDRDVEVTIKLDGSSMTVFDLSDPEKYGKVPQEDGHYFGICSRNLELQTDQVSTFTTVLTNEQKANIRALGYDVVFQGELLNTNIQGNYEKVSMPEFHVYSVFVFVGNTCLVVDPIEAKTICEHVGLKYVPVLFTGKLRDYADSFEKIKELSDGPGMNEGVKREGIVVKSLEMDDKEYFSFKQISETYLLNEK